MKNYIKIPIYRYYSSNSACIPRVFVTTEENTWQFSITITIFNFLSFVFVAIAYFLILIKTKENRLQASNSVIHRPREDKGKGKEYYSIWFWISRLVCKQIVLKIKWIYTVYGVFNALAPGMILFSLLHLSLFT